MVGNDLNSLPAVASHSQGPINFSELRNTEDKSWKQRVICKMLTLCCNWLAVFMFLVIGGMGIKIRNNDYIVDLTIYTQAVDDWTEPLWKEFGIYAEECPSGWEPIVAPWLGTVEGNYTDDGVEKTDNRWKGPIKANPPVD